MIKAFSKNDFECANWYSDFVDESKIFNESFKVNFIYLKGLILSQTYTFKDSDIIKDEIITGDNTTGNVDNIIE